MPLNLVRVATHEMVACPIGRFTVGDGFLIWCTTPELCGLALWGRMTAANLELLTRVYDQGRASGIAVPCDFVFDARRLEGLEPDVYETLASDTAARILDLRQRLRRQAFLRNSSMLGAAISGFYPVLEVQFDARVFTELAPALTWLGELDDTLATYLDELVAEAVSGTSLVDRLRAWLAAHPASASIDATCRALGLSSRSLQRHLRESGTSFRVEVDRARLVLAQQLLRETNLKIASIAERVGASSEANFIALFRRLTTTSPAEWRRRHRDHA